MPDFVSRLPGAKDTRQVRDLYNALVDQIDQGAIDIEYRLDADCTLTGVRPFMKMSEGFSKNMEKGPLLQNVILKKEKNYRSLGCILFCL